ncbi:restriction endonuclease [Acinetobacter terrae]|uniref:restriction endonuclease n=1 Tax=Acinetobacter terrae TaxID=2731247 RepID=UPI000A352D8C|nr:restriction endonuclease [Acinetobacter terrae]OTG73401.1 restriction endonuclease [Acinetobacter terrae]
MNEIQLFENAFAVTFPVEAAEMVLNRIGDVYGAEFSKKYAGYSDEELIRLACTVLSGLNHVDIARGVLRMNSEEWCPNLPKFRSWCEQGGDWWTADQAWAKAMQFESDPSSKITTLAKRALEEVRHILTVEGQKSAHYAFRDIYQDYLRRAKEAGRVQEMWVKPKAAKAISFDEGNRKGVLCPPDLLKKLKGVNAFTRKGGAA